jgi:hypothetical protein
MPQATYRYLTDSNVDWGQQLLSVKSYLDRNNITDCWFGYFAQPAIDYHAYGIPCQQLPTADSISMKQQVDASASISGTVLISAGTLTGYEFGSVALSPFQPFMYEVPVTIDHGVFVYHGTFNTSFVSSLGHATRATTLFAERKYPAALEEVEQAVAIDSKVFQAQMILGDTLAALHKDQSSAAAYNRALEITQTMEPSEQADWTETINARRKKLHL